MRTRTDPLHPGTQTADLLILLPPAKATLEDLIAQGLPADVRASGWAIDLLLAEPSTEEVLSLRVAEHLHQQVVAPARQAGYRQIWMAGISLGAFNALHYAAAFEGMLAGLLLLAPYPGTGDILQEIEQAGGPRAWGATAAIPLADERIWWHWLCRRAAGQTAPLALYAGLAQQDRFQRGQALLASLLPASEIDHLPGEHCWSVWQQMWPRALAHGRSLAGGMR